MFKDRADAGARLAEALEKLNLSDPVIYALPRGGVPVGAATANRLHAPLDLILVRKLGAPGHPEIAVGAVVDGPSPTVIRHEETLEQMGISDSFIAEQTSAALSEIDRRRALYLKDRKPISPENQTAIIVDDGLATGATMEAAIKALRTAKPLNIIVAVPTSSGEAAGKMLKIADHTVCLEVPTPFWSIGARYDDFHQLTDEDVMHYLENGLPSGLARRPA